MSANRPSKIQLHKRSKQLELAYKGQSYFLSAEFLRVHSTSAEVKGHGPGQEVLVSGKMNVGIETIKATGNYGLQIVFDDEHDSGIYSWSYLHELSLNQDKWWQDYLDKLQSAQKSRDPLVSVIQFSP